MIKLKVVWLFIFPLYSILTMETALADDPIKYKLLHTRESLLTRNATGVKQEVDELLCELQRSLTTNSLNFLDASGKLPAGVLVLNTNHFGNFDQCLSIDETVEEVKIQGKYCMMQTTISLDTDIVAPVGLIDAQGFSMSGLFGVCVPDACPGTIDNVLPGVEILANELYCRRSNDKPIEAHDIVAIVVFSILGLLILAGTVYQLYYKILYSKDVPKIIKTFSAYHQTDKLMTLPTKPHPLSCISGIKTLSTLWVILGHHYYQVLIGVVSNPIDLWQFAESFGARFIVAGPLAVDTFFFIGAFLLTWSLLKQFNNKVSYAKSVPIIALNRYLRLTPVLATVMLLKISLFNHVSDGPYWVMADSMFGSCLKIWWVNLLYIQNYLNYMNTGMDIQCLPETWYLAFDMQLNLAAPFLIIFLFGGMKSAIYALIVTCVTMLGAVLGFHLFLYGQSPNMEGSFGELLFRNTTTTTSQFLVGIVVAYVMFQMKKRNMTITNKLYMVAHWVITAALLILSFHGVYSTSQAGVSQATIIVFNAWHKPAWVLGVSGVIVACMHGFGGPVQWFLGHRMWIIPARLSYGMYLLHFQIIFVFLASIPAPFVFSNGDMLTSCITIVALTMIASCIVYIFVEAPFADLTNMLMEKISGRKREDTSKTEPSKDIQPSSSEEAIKEKQDQ